jgi:hypothetical protein
VENNAQQHAIQRISISILLLAAFLAGASVISHSTQITMGFSPDSASYLSGAENILAGRGYVDQHYYSPITVYPPGYSLMLAIGGRIGLDLKTSARIWATFLFGLIAMLSAMLTYLYTGSVVLALCASAIGLSSKDMIHNFSMVHSEAPFVVIVLIYLLLMSYYFETKRFMAFIAIVFVSSLAMMIRYLGACLILSTSILVMITESTMKQKIKYIIISGLGGIPTVFWFIRNAIVSKYIYVETVDTSMSFSAANWWKAAQTIKDWTNKPVGICLFLIFCILFLTTIGFREGSRKKIKTPITIMVVFIVSYILVLLASVRALRIATSFDGRILLPIFVPLLLVIVLSLYRLSKGLASRIDASKFRNSAQICCIVLICAFLLIAIRATRGNSDPFVRRGFTWLTGPDALHAFRTLDSKSIVFSNADDYIYLFTGRPSYRLPMVYRIDNLSEKMSDYDQKIAFLKNTLGRDGIIVYFNRSRRAYVPSEKDLQEILPLKIIVTTRDGTIYRVAYDN